VTDDGERLIAEALVRISEQIDSLQTTVGWMRNELIFYRQAVERIESAIEAGRAGEEKP
jgi:phage-related holin